MTGVPSSCGRWAGSTPERVSSLFNMSVPFSQSPGPPTETFKVIFEGKFFYIMYFQPVGPAEAELEADPRHFLRTILYAAGGEAMADGNALLVDFPSEGTRFIDTLTPAPAQLPPWLTEEDVDVYAAAFEKSGFFGPVSYYRNMDANWERSKDLGPSTYTMPVGFLTGSLDAVATMLPGAVEAMAAIVPRLPRRHLGGGGRSLGAAGAAGGDQRRPAGLPGRGRLTSPHPGAPGLAPERLGAAIRGRPRVLRRRNSSSARSRKSRELLPAVLVALAGELEVLDRSTERAQGLHDLAGLAERHVGVQFAVHHQDGGPHPLHVAHGRDAGQEPGVASGVAVLGDGGLGDPGLGVPVEGEQVRHAAHVHGGDEERRDRAPGP